MSKTKQFTNLKMTRRNILAGGATALIGLTLSGFSHASATDVEKIIIGLAGGKTPKTGKITLDMPQIAENGNTVPLSVSVESPMTASDHVKSIHVFANGNPTPEVAVFHLSPINGVADVSSRMRMAKTQNIVAVAKMSDGSVYTESVKVKVTIGGCGG